MLNQTKIKTEKKIKAEKRIYIILLMLAVTICGLCYTESRKKETLNFGSERQKGEKSFLPQVKKVETIQIELNGAVVSPGIYVLTNTDTIGDVVEKAGGFTENADTKKLNLRDSIFDGELLSIPEKEGGEKPFVSYSPTLFDTCFSYDEGESQDFLLTEKIDINVAGSKELQCLPQIGKKLAGNIIQYRKDHGRFEKIEDIKNVPKIGEKIYEEIRDKIKIN